MRDPTTLLQPIERPKLLRFARHLTPYVAWLLGCFAVMDDLAPPHPEPPR